jgi:hypothetical protein
MGKMLCEKCTPLGDKSFIPTNKSHSKIPMVAIWAGLERVELELLG